MDHEPPGGGASNGMNAEVDAAVGERLFAALSGGRAVPQSSFLPLAHALPVAVYVTDRQGYVVYHNAAAAALWGFDPGPGEVRWCGSDALFRCSGEPLDHAHSPMALALNVANGEAAGQPHEIFARRRDGGRYSFVPHSQVLNDAQGEVMGAAHVILGVSDRDRSDEDRHRLAAIVDSSDDAIISKLLDGTITSWNGAAERLFGWTSDEIVGQSILTLIPEDRRDEETSIIERLRRGERVEHFETVRQHKSGAPIIISLTISPIRRGDGTIIGASKIARDIGQAKRGAELLQRQAERLETLNRIARIISQDLDLDRIVQAVTDEATAVSGAKFGAFFYNVVDADGEAYLLYSLSGAARDSFDRIGMPRNTAIFGPTFAGEGIVRSGDIRKDPRYGRNAPHQGMPQGHLPVVSYLAVPVMSASGEVIGGLFFGHDEPDRFGPETEALIEGIAAQAAVALDNARLHRAAQAEIAQRKAAEAARELLLHEVKHRVKNTLATIQALATQTLKGAPPEEKDVFIGRLHALSAAHDLLTTSDWQEIGITALASQSLAAFTGEGAERVSLDGPDVGLTSNKALLLTMVLHELGTNAVKYGALSVEEGQVAVTWRMAIAERPTLSMQWRESGGPRVHPPQRRGFGSRMIAAALQGSDGSVAFDYRPEGLVVTMEVVL